MSILGIRVNGGTGLIPPLSVAKVAVHSGGPWWSMVVLIPNPLEDLVARNPKRVARTMNDILHRDIAKAEAAAMLPGHFGIFPFFSKWFSLVSGEELC